METSGFDDQMFNEFSSEAVGVLSPLGPKAIQHHPHHHHFFSNSNTIMIGNSNGDINQQQRLPDVHQILPGNSPKMDHYKMYDVKIESSPYSPNGKLDYINGTTKLEPYSPSPGQKLEYTTNGQYSPNAKIIEYTSSHGHMEHNMMFQQPQPVDSNQQNVINGTNSNFKRKSDENLNNLSGSPPTTINNISPSDATSSMPNKKPVDKKKNDPNGVKKKKTR